MAGDFQTYNDVVYQLKFNVGGALNHDFFWAGLTMPQSMGGTGGVIPKGYTLPLH